VNLALALIPRRLPVLQLRAAFNSLIEHHQRMIDGILRIQEFREFQQNPPRFGINLDIADQRGVGMFRLE
jgi:hypothetical protein